MINGFLLSRVLLKFQSQEDDLIGELSAIARTPDGSLWVGSDEFTTLERLIPLDAGVYGGHQSFRLADFLPLSEKDGEIDIEGLDYSEGYLWVVGSHSLKRHKTKGKKIEKDIQRLSEIERESNRYLLARLPILNGEIVPTYARSDQKETVLSAAMLQKTQDQNILMEALAEDEHLAPFLQMNLPSKDNGFDIEGLAVRGNRVFLGLRGPVLRGWAIMLDIEVEMTEPGVLTLKDLGDGKRYRKHFLNLNGLGIRELCLQHNDLIILAGPTMELEGEMEVFRFNDVLDLDQDTLWDQDSERLNPLFDLPFTIGSDHAEGLTLFPCLGEKQQLMIVYDSPDDNRRPQKNTIYVDVFQLPKRKSD